MRAPYGSIKQIVAAMKLGESKTVLPQHVVSFHNAARRLGLRIATAGSRETGVLRYTVVGIADDWPSGHVVCRLARRDRRTGRWLRDRK